MRKSESNATQKVTRFFESKAENNTTADYKQKKFHMPFEVDILNTGVRRIKNINEWLP